MSKITFRADDDLVERVEALETSKSEVMRDALRTYLDGRRPGGGARSARAGTRGREGNEGREGRGERVDGGEHDRDDGERNLDELVGERVDAMVASRLDEAAGGQDVNVTVNLAGDGGPTDESVERAQGGERAQDGERVGQQADIDRWAAGSDAGPARDEPGYARPAAAGRRCAQCGEDVREDHVYCPNCGEKATRRVFCDCGDELRSDWAYCPGCGRRTPSADVLGQ